MTPTAIRRGAAVRPTRPNIVVARTRKECGVSFMEDRMESHYLPLTEAQYRHAVEEIERHA